MGLGGFGDRLEGGLNFFNQSGEMPQLHGVRCTFDRPAARMTHHEDELRAGDAAREFHASDNIIADNVAGDADAEYIADALIENEFRGYSGIDAAENGREGELAFGGILHLAEEVPLYRTAGKEAPISLFKHLNGDSGCDFCLGFPGMCFHRYINIGNGAGGQGGEGSIEGSGLFRGTVRRRQAGMRRRNDRQPQEVS